MDRIGSIGLMDVLPTKILPTWSNNQIGDAYIAKRLDRFLISENMLGLNLQIKHWISRGGESDHKPIFQYFDPATEKHMGPFKLNLHWLQHQPLIEKY